MRPSIVTAVSCVRYNPPDKTKNLPSAKNKIKRTNRALRTKRRCVAPVSISIFSKLLFFFFFENLLSFLSRTKCVKAMCGVVAFWTNAVGHRGITVPRPLVYRELHIHSRTLAASDKN